jgi:transcriptional regulator with XRE-family HTH domain
MKYDATKVKRARLTKGWTQERLASIADVKQATISNIEAGKTNSPSTWKRVADALGLELEGLIVEGEHAS